MKLPDCDNRLPHPQLYSPKEAPPFGTSKSLLRGVALPLGLVACVVVFCYALLGALFP